MNILWGSLLVGIFTIAVAVIILPNDGVFWGHPVPATGIFLILLFGVILTASSIRGLLRGDGKAQKKEYTNEDAAKAKDELEKMYLKQHGRLPEYSEEIKNTLMRRKKRPKENLYAEVLKKKPGA